MSIISLKRHFIYILRNHHDRYNSGSSFKCLNTKGKVNKKFAKLISEMSSERSLRDAVLRSFLENPDLSLMEITERLGAKYNSVKAVFAQLSEDGLLIREGRGNYSPNLPKIILSLMDRIEDLEKERK